MMKCRQIIMSKIKGKGKTSKPCLTREVIHKRCVKIEMQKYADGIFVHGGEGIKERTWWGWDKREVGCFAKDLDLGLFDHFKNVKDGVLLDNEGIATKEKVGEEQGAEEQGHDAII